MRKLSVNEPKGELENAEKEKERKKNKCKNIKSTIKYKIINTNAKYLKNFKR